MYACPPHISVCYYLTLLLFSGWYNDIEVSLPLPIPAPPHLYVKISPCRCSRAGTTTLSGPRGGSDHPGAAGGEEASGCEEVWVDVGAWEAQGTLESSWEDRQREIWEVVFHVTIPPQ